MGVVRFVLFVFFGCMGVFLGQAHQDQHQAELEVDSVCACVHEGLTILG